MADELNSVLRPQSRYVAGGVTEVNAKALEWWERNVYPTSADDQFYVVDRKFQGRLDLISALYLGEPRYWWVIAQLNNILDPYAEVKPGVILRIPSKVRVDAMLSGGKTGGIPSTREVPLAVLPLV